MCMTTLLQVRLEIEKVLDIATIYTYIYIYT